MPVDQVKNGTGDNEKGFFEVVRRSRWCIMVFFVVFGEEIFYKVAHVDGWVKVLARGGGGEGGILVIYHLRIHGRGIRVFGSHRSSRSDQSDVEDGGVEDDSRKGRYWPNALKYACW